MVPSRRLEIESANYVPKLSRARLRDFNEVMQHSEQLFMSTRTAETTSCPQIHPKEAIVPSSGWSSAGTALFNANLLDFEAFVFLAKDEA